VGAGLARRVARFGHASAGLAILARSQADARLHVAAATAAIALGAWLGIPRRDWALVALAIGLVITAEALNTAIEAAVDLACPTPHPLAKTAKDVAAGAVLVAAVTALAVAGLVLGPALVARVVGPPG